ncbi:hypothetical protein APY03_0741 [Variovorax sp. WDL1]|nr:hypothetical protein APY03_0741 [Variovorax sp. WDL1]
MNMRKQLFRALGGNELLETERGVGVLLVPKSLPQARLALPDVRKQKQRACKVLVTHAVTRSGECLPCLGESGFEHCVERFAASAQPEVLRIPGSLQGEDGADHNVGGGQGRVWRSHAAIASWLEAGLALG